MGFYGLADALFLAAVVGAFSIGYGKGSASRNGEIAEYQAAIEVSKRLAADAERKASEASARVVVEYRDRVRVIEKRVPGEIQLIETIRESANCPVPPELVQLWNGGSSPDSQDAQGSSGVNAAPVTLAEVAEAAAEARRRFEVNAARLEALQSLVKSQ